MLCGVALLARILSLVLLGVGERATLWLQSRVVHELRLRLSWQEFGLIRGLLIIKLLLDLALEIVDYLQLASVVRGRIINLIVQVGQRQDLLSRFQSPLESRSWSELIQMTTLDYLPSLTQYFMDALQLV